MNLGNPTPPQLLHIHIDFKGVLLCSHGVQVGSTESLEIAETNFQGLVACAQPLPYPDKAAWAIKTLQNAAKEIGDKNPELSNRIRAKAECLQTSFDRIVIAAAIMSPQL